MADIWTTVSKLSLEALSDDTSAATSPHPPAGTSMTAAKIEAIIAKLRRIGFWNGYSGIARSEGVCKEWVLEVEAARKKALAEKISAQIEEIE